jgi:hypothetical protein
MDKHTETIRCTECEKVQQAEVVHTFPWYTFVHTCEFCEYIIMESEWERVDNK